MNAVIAARMVFFAENAAGIVSTIDEVCRRLEGRPVEVRIHNPHAVPVHSFRVAPLNDIVVQFQRGVGTVFFGANFAASVRIIADEKRSGSSELRRLRSVRVIRDENVNGDSFALLVLAWN